MLSFIEAPSNNNERRQKENERNKQTSQVETASRGRQRRGGDVGLGRARLFWLWSPRVGRSLKAHSNLGVLGKLRRCRKRGQWKWRCTIAPSDTLGCFRSGGETTIFALSREESLVGPHQRARTRDYSQVMTAVMFILLHCCTPRAIYIALAISMGERLCDTDRRLTTTDNPRTGPLFIPMKRSCVPSPPRRFTLRVPVMRVDYHCRSRRQQLGGQLSAPARTAFVSLMG